MIEEPPILTVQRPKRRPTPSQIALFQKVPTGFVVDAMYGGGALTANIRPLGDGRDLDCRAAGPALTVDCGPGDILALVGSLPFVQKGDVVIATAHGHQGCAIVGDRVVTMMKNSGAAGFVTDAPMRDYAGLVAAGLPCWSTGLHPGSPFSTGPGRIGLPIQIAGQQVETGDIVVADRDGVVVVPFARIDEVIRALKNVTELEEALDQELAKGLTVPPAIQSLMESKKVKFV